MYVFVWYLKSVSEYSVNIHVYSTHNDAGSTLSHVHESEGEEAYENLSCHMRYYFNCLLRDILVVVIEMCYDQWIDTLKIIIAIGNRLCCCSSDQYKKTKIAYIHNYVHCNTEKNITTL